jgi:hypothetical protein
MLRNEKEKCFILCTDERHGWAKRLQNPLMKDCSSAFLAMEK